MKTASAPAIAYSYLRFSSPAQSEGDSIRRQTNLRDGWLKRHPEVRLDTSLKMVDDGVSGFTGAHRKDKKHALGSFLDLVEREMIPNGSYLIVENLDRLTRENPLDSIPAVIQLIKAGILVVQLARPEIVYSLDMDQTQLMVMLMELSRGHGESKRKSGLCGEAWKEKKQQARKKKTPYGKMCPAWLELLDGHYRVKEDAAQAVRSIFRWCVEGFGAFGILARLNKEKIPAIGRKSHWERSYVRKLLMSPAVIGTYQPCVGSRKRKPDGEPIPGYYPAVISEAQWYAAQAAIKARKRRSGRPSTTSIQPFSGILFDAIDQAKLHVAGTTGYKYLVSHATLMKRSGTHWRTFPMSPLVDALLSELRELAAADLFTDPSGARISELTGRILDVEKRLSVARERFDADPESPTWADMVTKYDAEKRSLAKELAEARQSAANPLTGTWAEAVELMSRNEPEKLRAALLATIESIYCMFVCVGKMVAGSGGIRPSTHSRLAAVQVNFPGGSRRDYLIHYWSGGRARKAGWQVRSILAQDFPLDLLGGGDLRNADEAGFVVDFLSGLTPDRVAHIFMGCPVQS